MLTPVLSDRRPALVGLSLLSVALAFLLVQGGPAIPIAIACAFVPLAAVVVPVIFTPAGRLVLVAAALTTPLTGLAVLAEPLPTPGPTLFPQDVMLGLALASGAVAWLEARRRGLPFELPWPGVLGWPFVVFALAITTATMRGHYSWGGTLFGQSMRLVLYAGILAALVGLRPREIRRAITFAFYGGTFVTTVLLVPYYVVTGTSQTDQSNLSTGGERVLGISTSLYLAGALFLALLNLRRAATVGERLLHLVVAGLAFIGVVAAFGRAVYAGVALVGLIILGTSRTIRSSILSMLPLALPFLLLFAIFLPRLAPDLVEAAKQRVSSPPQQDANVQWRLKASAAVWDQIREQPIVGVGFGRTSEFYVNVESSAGFLVPVKQRGFQDPHNGYLYLWAGGGLIALGAFLLMIGRFGWDAVGRYRATEDPDARLLLAWCGATAATFLLNAATEPTFSGPNDLLTIWTLFALPGVVVLRQRAVAQRAGRREPLRPRPTLARPRRTA